MFKKLRKRQEKESRETKNRTNKKIKIKMLDLSPNISIIVLHVNDLNIPIKRQRFPE